MGFLLNIKKKVNYKGNKRDKMDEFNSTLSMLSGLLGENNGSVKGNSSITGLYNTNATDALTSIDECINDIDTTKMNRNRNVYVVCEGKSFRSESLYSELSKEYKVKMILLKQEPVLEFENALFFLIDITNFEMIKVVQKIVKEVQEQAFKQGVPIFILGEASDLSNINSYIRKDAEVKEFERPIQIKEMLSDIEQYIANIAVKGNRKHIMVVDDSITFLRLVQKTLEKKYRVTVTPSAFECIKTLGSMEVLPDLIIIDYMMPTCDGLTLCKMIKENKLTQGIPVIFYSGNNNVNEIIQLMPMIDGYVLKSTPVANLEEYLEKLFEKKKKEQKIIKQCMEKKKKKKKQAS